MPARPAWPSPSPPRRHGQSPRPLAAVALSILLGSAIGAATPNVEVAIEVGAVIRTGAGAFLVGALAALLPLRRVLRVDPATAFRRP